ncbi:MAG: glucosylceramidase [Saprospiraceae bacterium]|nr:glucosylceramidase [Saprospiraceae bacterium]
MSLFKYSLLAALCFLTLNCSKKVNKNRQTASQITVWLTKSDQTALLQKQNTPLVFGPETNSFPTIKVDETTRFQTMDGFGYTLTGGSADVINRMKSADKAALLQELFSPNQMAISYLRISIGASDLHATSFTYDDVPKGETDTALKYFSLDKDRKGVIALLKEILTINPKIKILATPWSPPLWMKDTFSFIGGSLQPQYYGVYAQYFVKYIQQMRTEGIDIEAITPQNEPLHPGNNPSLLMLATQQADFIKNHLAPAFQKANIKTKIIVYDHNCDRPDYPLAILNDPSVKPYVWGSAFHLYAGDASALSKVHEAHPDKHLYFTEQYTGIDGQFGGDLHWHIQNVVIGTIRNWSRTAFEWNLANDPKFEPHTEGGCTTCKGALTIGEKVERNVAYYIIGHASRFVPPNSVRISSNFVGQVQNVAFKTPAGKIVLIAENNSAKDETFNIRYNGKSALVTLPSGSVATYVW